MSTNRKKILSLLEKQANLDNEAIKIAQNTKLAEIKDSQEYADKVFDALLNNLVIEGLED